MGIMRFICRTSRFWETVVE